MISLNENLTKLNNYSDEVVVGIFNGKSLYRKMIKYSDSIANKAQPIVDSSLTSSVIEFCSEISGSFYDSSDDAFRVIPYALDDGGTHSHVRVMICTAGVLVQNTSGYTISNVGLTIYYTKK